MSARGIVLSAEQRAAVLTPGNLIVRAGAGSGKTEVLARRFVALMAGDIGGEPLMPDRIAAITFTEKAAYDMRARIAAVLHERMAAETDEPRLGHLRRAARILPLARLSTIHAFCARILRENAVEANLDPDFQVLDEYESRTFFERLCKQAFVDAIRRGDPGALHLARARRMAGGGWRESGVQIVLRIITECARLGRDSQWIFDATRRTADRIAARGDRIPDLARELIELTEKLLGVKGLTGAAEAKMSLLRPQWAEFRRRLCALSESAEPEAFDFLREFCGCLPEARSGKVKEYVKAIREITAVSDDYFGLKGGLIGAYGEIRGARRALDAAGLIVKVSSVFERAKAQERVVTFDDLLMKVRDLLRDKREVANRYRASIRALLVDEYQDTDPVQDEIVALLSDRAPADAVSPPELFIVGDEKQSIYRFRGADVKVFNSPRAASETLPLSGNRRSAPNILKFVNALGAQAMRWPNSPAPPYWVQWSVEHELKPMRETALDPPVEIIVGIDDGLAGLARRPGVAEKRPLEAKAIAARIRRLIAAGEMVADAASGQLRQAAYGDIVILLRAFSDVSMYERALITAGIPCYTVKGRGFFGRQEVIDLIELLAAVNNPHDSAALAATLRSPFFALSDKCLLEIALHHRERISAGDHFGALSLASAFWAHTDDFAWLGDEAESVMRARTLLAELRGLRDRGSIMEVIERALDATGYEAVMLGLPQGRQRAANIRKLVEVARDFQARRFFGFHDFIAHLRRLTEEEPYEPQAQILGENENVVRLMTVHQAKGLEFPIVIVADTGRNPASDNLMPALDPEHGLVMRDTAGSGMDEIPNSMLDDHRQRVKNEQAAESVRLMYVALTRARDRLIVSEGAGSGEWAGKIRELVGADEIEDFTNSSSPFKEIVCNGARVLLVRPETNAATPDRSELFVDAAVIDHFAEIARRRLSFATVVSGELVISPTALADFDRCPYQFNLRRAGVPEFFGEGAAHGSIAMGTVAHAVLEQIELGSGGPPSDDHIARLVEALGGAAGLDADQRSEIVRDLRRYAGSMSPDNAAIRREVPFFVNVAGSMFVRGRIDAIIDEGARLLVRDYKYARAAEEADFYRVQMECYVMAVAIANPGRRVDAEIVFLRGGATAVAIELSRPEDIRARLMELGLAVLDAEASGIYGRKPTDAASCRKLRCGFVARCWKH